MRLRAFSSLFDRINAIFFKNHVSQTRITLILRHVWNVRAIGQLDSLWFMVVSSSLSYLIPAMFRIDQCFFCIRLHSHALIRGLRVFELSHLRLHLRLIPLLLRDQLWNGSTPAPYWQCYKVRNSRFVIMNSADHPRREIRVLRKTLPGWSILKNIGRPISF